jgi:hypothetical protein
MQERAVRIDVAGGLRWRMPMRGGKEEGPGAGPAAISAIAAPLAVDHTGVEETNASMIAAADKIIPDR